MSFKGDLSTIGLAEVFQMISMSQKEGTLVVVDAESRKAIYFGKDGVQLHSAGKRKGFRIGDILVRAGKITVAQLREVLEQQAGTRRMLGQELVARGLVSEQEIEDVVRSQIEEEIYDLFLWRKANFEFIEGDPIDELQDPETKAIRLSFDVNSLLLEAVRRTDEWTLINQKIPSMDCIYTFVSSSAREEEDGSAADQNRTVFQYVDGQATVADVIEQSFVPRFEVCKIIVDLLDRGRIRLLTPPELVAVARRKLEEGVRDRGLRLFGVAAQLAPEDPDLIGKYAHALETEGMIQEAARMYVRVGHLLKQQGQEKDALAYFQRAVSLNPDDMQSKIALFEINLATASVEEAMATATELIQSCLRERDYETAREIAEQAVQAAPQSLEVRLLLAKVYHALGLKKERDEVVLFLRKNLPVDQAAADKIIADLREFAEKTAEAVTRVPGPSGGRRRRGGISVGRLAGVLLLLVLLGGAGFAGWFEWQARDDLATLMADAATLEKEALAAIDPAVRAKKYSQAEARIRDFERNRGAMSPFATAKMKDELAKLGARRSAGEIKVPPPPPPPPPIDPKPELIRLYNELSGLAEHGEYDAALERCGPVIRLADELGQHEISKKAQAIQGRLAPMLREVMNKKVEADHYESIGKYREACQIVESLHKGYRFWKAARSALYPFAVLLRPVGVSVYMKKGSDPWGREPIATTTARDDGTIDPVVLHLEFGHGKFVLRFEREGFVTRERHVDDERAGEVVEWLSDRIPKDQGPIGAVIQADPTLAGGLLYLWLEASGQRTVTVMRPNRSFAWVERADTAARIGPGDLVYFGRGKSMVGVDGRKASEERVTWEYPTDAPVTTSAAFSAKGDIVYFATERKLHAVEHATRNLIWTRDLPDRVVGAAVENEGLVYVACANGSLYAYGSGNGPTWQYATDGRLRDTPVLDSGTLYVCSSDGALHAIDARSGERKWLAAVKLPADSEARPCVFGGRIYVSCVDGTVVCVEAGGAERWRQKPGTGPIRAPVVGAGRLVFVGDMQHVFHAIDAQTGQPQWKFVTRGPIRTAGGIIDSRVYVVSEDRNVYVLPTD